MPYDSRRLCDSNPWMSAVTEVIEVWRDEEAVIKANAVARSRSIPVAFVTTESAHAHHAWETSWSRLVSRRDLRIFSVLGRDA